MASTFITNITVLGGLPVTVKARIADAEPDVGIFDAWVDDWEVVAINGRKLKSAKHADWIYRRMSQDDQQQAATDILESEG